jgi:hypothetical protein
MQPRRWRFIPILLQRIGGTSFSDIEPALAVRDGTFFAFAARVRTFHRSGQVPTDIEASMLAQGVVEHLVARLRIGP